MGKRGNKKLGNYIRTCKRCGYRFKTIYPTSTSCNMCHKPKYYNRWGKRDLDNRIEYGI